MRTNDLKTNREWWCGYCKKLLYPLTQEQFLQHTKHCEVDCCDKNHGELSGDNA